MISVTKVMLLCCVGVLLGLAGQARGHGRLMEPVGRSSAWRKGFATPHNYNDNALFCGGFATMQNNGGKCGVCGDPYNGRRDNEPPNGQYATGTIVKTYQENQVIMAKAEITANHHGYIEYRICAHNDVTTPVTQECLDQHVLQRADGKGTKVTIPGGEVGYFNMEFQLPRGMTCTQCVIQWKYHTANSWGVDPDTHEGCIGCGAQEEFYACADVAITPEAGIISVPAVATKTTTRAPTTQAPTKAPTTQTPRVTHAATTRTTTPIVTRAPTTQTPKPVTTRPPTTTQTTPIARTTSTANGNTVSQTTSLPCHGINEWAGIPSMDVWCTENCGKGDCPPYGCSCGDHTVTTSAKTTSSTTQKPTTTPSTTQKPTTTPSTTQRPTTTSSTTQRPTTTSSTTRKPTTTLSTTQKPTTTPSTTQKPTTTPTITTHIPTTTTFKTKKPTTPSKTTSKPTATSTVQSVPPSSHYVDRVVCKAINLWAGNDYLDRWCADACARGNCPQDSCKCSTVQTLITEPTTLALLPLVTSASTEKQNRQQIQGVCKGVGEYEDIEVFDQWCADECVLGNCDEDMCSCSTSSVQALPVTTMALPVTTMSRDTTDSPVVTSSSNRKCSSNGVVAGDYWDGWCQDRCDHDDCEIDYCNCY